jgi:hypothetical protein
MTGETFNLPMFCAVHDKPFVMIFARQPNGKYQCTESIKIEGKPTGTAYATTSNIIRLDQIEGRRFPCPWCGKGGINHCGGGCEAYICGGRTFGPAFQCRDSCGAFWFGIPLETVNAETTQECLAAPVKNMVNPKLRQSTALARVEPLTTVRKSWWKK